MKARLSLSVAGIILILAIKPLSTREVLFLEPIFSERDAVLIPEFEGEWETGLPSADAKVILDGEPGYTVYYHADLKQWVMVCGPGFMNNKIRLRTASALTGPWSEEQVICECPEPTPGSTSFEKDKFCYFGREHIEFYNAKNQTLLLTYDCNSASFSKAVSDDSIYVPRVLSIPLGNRRQQKQGLRR